MPIYEYKCPECGQHFEKLVMSSDEQVECTKCGCQKVDKQMSGFALGGGGIGEAVAASGCGSGGFS